MAKQKEKGTLSGTLMSAMRSFLQFLITIFLILIGLILLIKIPQIIKSKKTSQNNQPQQKELIQTEHLAQEKQKEEIELNVIKATRSNTQDKYSRFGGHVHLINKDYKLSEQELQRNLHAHGKAKKASNIFFRNNSQKGPYDYASALGIDKKHHFINSYLCGYAPFITDKHWIPLYVTANRMTYQYDSAQFHGKDVWQTSRQAFLNTRGDCEDHSILLADWLIELGLDAKVVLGAHKNEGHAWVVVVKNKKTFLIEATSKQKHMHWKHYPLAKLKTNYHPEFMFNRDFLWVNTGTSLTTNYSGKHWQKMSEHHESHAAPPSKTPDTTIEKTSTL